MNKKWCILSRRGAEEWGRGERSGAETEKLGAREHEGRGGRAGGRRGGGHAYGRWNLTEDWRGWPVDVTKRERTREKVSRCGGVISVGPLGGLIKTGAPWKCDVDGWLLTKTKERKGPGNERTVSRPNIGKRFCEEEKGGGEEKEKNSLDNFPLFTIFFLLPPPSLPPSLFFPLLECLFN